MDDAQGAGGLGGQLKVIWKREKMKILAQSDLEKRKVESLATRILQQENGNLGKENLEKRKVEILEKLKILARTILATR